VYVGGTHERILLERDAVEGTERMGSLDARNFWVSISHKRIPYLHGASALEDIDPDGASAVGKFERKKNRDPEDSLAQRVSVLAKEIIQRVRVGLDVELDLSLLHDLRHTQLSTAPDDRTRDAPQSWPPGSWARYQSDAGGHGVL